MPKTSPNGDAPKVEPERKPLHSERPHVQRNQHVADDTCADGWERGVGICPNRTAGLGHVWRPRTEDAQRHCRFCELTGHEYFEAQTEAIAKLHSGLRAPDSAHGKPAVKK